MNKFFTFFLFVTLCLPNIAFTQSFSNESNKKIRQMRKSITRILKLQKEAREKSDIVKIDCINEKFTLVKGIVKVAEMADINLREAEVQGDNSLVEAEMAKVELSDDRVKQLLIEAESCVGEGEVIAGDSVLEVSVEKGQVKPSENKGSLSGTGVNTPVSSGAAEKGGGNQQDPGEVSSGGTDVTEEL